MTATFLINENEVHSKGKRTFDYSTMIFQFKVTSRYKRPTGTKTITAPLIKENAKTVLVSYDGKVIKRHKLRDNVEVQHG